MTVVAAIFLVVAVWLAVLLGPDLSMWVWGPALLALGLAVAAAMPGLWRRSGRLAGGGWLALGTVVVAWFGWRAWTSPVAELGMADGLLLAGVVGCLLVVRAIQGQPAAERVFMWGLALLVLASVVVVGRQVVDPAFTPGFVPRFPFPSGFFGHYIDGATFLTGSSCLIGGAALAGRHHRFERLAWGLIAVAGMAAVYVTRSRGGICGAAVGLGVFAVMALIIGKRQGARWFAPGIVALPLIGLVVAGFLLKGWSGAQEMRQQAAGVDTVVDNTVRLHLIDIAASCIGLHPWQGGGSRSFSWECNRFWEMELHGQGDRRPEQVHNELLQTATDYGIIGAALLCLCVGAMVVAAVIRTLFAESTSPSANGDGWRLGGLAGLAGILMQSNFSFVFHMVPGALLLGLCLGSATHPGQAGKVIAARSLGTAMLACALAAACAALLVPMGWRGGRVTAVRWADHHARPMVIAPEARIAALTEAIRLWPLQEFYQERAENFQRQAARSPRGTSDEAALNRAVDDYREASALHPFAAGPVVNRANLLGLLGRDGEALQQFDRAINLQGGMEAAFKGAYSKAAYLHLKAERLLAAQRKDEALATLLAARDTLENSTSMVVWGAQGQAARALRGGIGGRLGVLLSAAGRDREAEEEFENTDRVVGDTGNRYLYACHLRMKAKRVWHERKPAEALGLFLKARQWLERTANYLPAGVTPEDYGTFRRELDECIAFLKGAKVEPVASPGQ